MNHHARRFGFRLPAACRARRSLTLLSLLMSGALQFEANGQVGGVLRDGKAIVFGEARAAGQETMIVIERSMQRSLPTAPVKTRGFGAVAGKGPSALTDGLRAIPPSLHLGASMSDAETAPSRRYGEMVSASADRLIAMESARISRPLLIPRPGAMPEETRRKLCSLAHKEQPANSSSRSSSPVDMLAEFRRRYGLEDRGKLDSSTAALIDREYGTLEAIARYSRMSKSDLPVRLDDDVVVIGLRRRVERRRELLDAWILRGGRVERWQIVMPASRGEPKRFVMLERDTSDDASAMLRRVALVRLQRLPVSVPAADTFTPASDGQPFVVELESTFGRVLEIGGRVISRAVIRSSISGIRGLMETGLVRYRSLLDTEGLAPVDLVLHDGGARPAEGAPEAVTTSIEITRADEFIRTIGVLRTMSPPPPSRPGGTGGAGGAGARGSDDLAEGGRMRAPGEPSAPGIDCSVKVCVDRSREATASLECAGIGTVEITTSGALTLSAESPAGGGSVSLQFSGE